MLHRAFTHPVRRLVLLAATVASTVATSPPPFDWTLDSSVPPEEITLAPKETIERRYIVDAQPDGASLTLRLDRLPASGMIATSTKRNDEAEQTASWRGANGRWSRDPSVYYEPTEAEPWIELPLSMVGPGRATFLARYRNDGAEPVRFTLSGKAELSGYDDDREGARVSLERAP